MDHTKDTFFTILGCMDGRFQELIDGYGRLRFGALYPDTITEAGMVAHLAKDDIDPAIKELVRSELVDISIAKHHSRGVIVFGHEECAGNPVDNATHLDHVRKAVAYIISVVPQPVLVIGLFVRHGEKGWEIEEVPQTVTV